MQQYQTYNSSYGYQNPIAGHTQQSQQQAQAGPGPADRGGQRQGAVANRTSANSSGGNSGSATILSKYELLGKIGEGTYGLVYLAYARDNPAKQYAIKTFKTAREADGISITAIREIMLLKELRHENIVRLDSVHINRAEPSISLAFDYAEHDLYEMIRTNRDKSLGPMDEYVVKSVMWQLLNGLAYMHKNWVLHRDLKPSNVLVMGEGPEHGQVKIADFGLARIFHAPLKPLSENGVVVTIWYRPPEVLLGAEHYTPALDVWAAACIWAELLMLRPLFQGQERKAAGNPFQDDQLDKIFRLLGPPSARDWPDLEHLPHWRDNTLNIRNKRSDSYQLESAILSQCTSMAATARKPMYLRAGSAAFRLMDRMLDYNPTRRITAEEALQHEYWQQEPVPGPNCFVPEGRPPICVYPKRGRMPVNTAELGGARAAPAQAAAGQQGGAQYQSAQAAAAPVQQKGGRKRKSDAGHR